MPIDVSVLCRRIDVEKTILLFGAGSSIPSGGPTGNQLSSALADAFNIDGGQNYNLSDLATIIEAKFNRRQLVEVLQDALKKLYPARGILNLSDYEWAGIFTTNWPYALIAAQKRHLTEQGGNKQLESQEMLGIQPIFQRCQIRI